MPIYEYVCEDCQAKTEAIRTMADADAVIACDQCGSHKTHRAYSVFLARGSENTGAQGSLPASPCGRCGDPRGSCGM